MKPALAKFWVFLKQLGRAPKYKTGIIKYGSANVNTCPQQVSEIRITMKKKEMPSV